MSDYRYIIGSGWWCSDDERTYRTFGEDVIRSSEFHKLWYQAVNKYTSPQKIIIVDSCSPVKPDLDESDDRLEFISLNINPGHSTEHHGKFCGCVRAMQVGLMYALECDTDYYVYVEQDGLLYGEEIIEYCISRMKTPYMFGSGEGTPQITQQSLFIIRQDGIWEFLKKLNSIQSRDNDISPEEKFHICCCKGHPRIYEFLKRASNFDKLRARIYDKLSREFRNYDHLPVGYGRVRPIGFDDKMFYFQQGDMEELQQYLELSDIKWP